MILCCLVVSHNVMSSGQAVDVKVLTTEMQKLFVEQQGVTPVTDFGVQGSDELAEKVGEFAGNSVSHVDYCRYLFCQIQKGHGKNITRRSSPAFARHLGPKSKKWGRKEAIPGLRRQVEQHPRYLRYHQKRGPLTFDQLRARAEKEASLQEQILKHENENQ